LLRGINVGGGNIIPMADLRGCFEGMGFTGVRTHIQSGNVVFRTKSRDVGQVTRKIEEAIEKEFGFRVDVIVRTAEELRDVVARNPFASREGIEPNKLLVTFLAGDPGPEARDRIERIQADREELLLLGRELYAYFPNGIGKSKLAAGPIDRALKVTGTARNWNTVTRLLQIAE